MGRPGGSPWHPRSSAGGPSSNSFVSATASFQRLDAGHRCRKGLGGLLCSSFSSHWLSPQARQGCYLPRPSAACTCVRRPPGGEPFRLRAYPTSRKNDSSSLLTAFEPVPKLCQNPIGLVYRELLFEREQLPQVSDNKHFRIALIERLEPAIVLRNHRVGLARWPPLRLVCFFGQIQYSINTPLSDKNSGVAFFLWFSCVWNHRHRRYVLYFR